MPRPVLRSVAAVPVERVQQQILVLRGQRVLLDFHLATLYAVEVRALLQAVRRNAERFPADFMFRLTREEWAALRSQIVILDGGRGRHRKYLPVAFTEQGIAMLSSVLRSPRAVLVNVGIMRAFVRLRRLIESDAQLARKLRSLERRMLEHDHRFVVVFDAIRRILGPPPLPARRRIGFPRGDGAGPAGRSEARRGSRGRR
jgi:hypothetical protein